MDFIFLLFGLFIILSGCEIFTNGIEWLGKRLRIGEGVVGSIFSAVGTCLPETMIPLIALFLTAQNGSNEDISVGAIIGAPFMLSSLAFLVTGLALIFNEKKRQTNCKITIDRKIISRDLLFFITMFTVGNAAAFVDNMMIKRIIAGSLVIFYILYIILTVKTDKNVQIVTQKHYLSSLLGKSPRFRFIIMQLILALAAIGWGAHLFITGMEGLSLRLKIPALILSLILTPVATELPEKFNSILWITRKKDTLAMGNITGAMTFQGAIPVAIGIAATAWDVSGYTLVCSALTLISALFMLLWIRTHRNVGLTPFIFGGLIYCVYLAYLFTYIIQ